MTDRIFDAFLARQQLEGSALAQESDLLTLRPTGSPADRYRVEFRCHGLVERAPGEVVEADRFEVGIWFPSTYLRVVDPFRVLTWLGPKNIFHPNISATDPIICIGRLAPGTGLVDILYQVHQVITWNKVTMREEDALNWPACQWARQHRDRFPVDRRPLKRRAVDLRAADVSERSQSNGETT
jgi:hypothetical protein